MLKQFFIIIRYNEWGSTKLFECLMLLMIGWRHQFYTHELGMFVCGLVFVGSYLALGYLINDLNDIAVDKQAGKQRGIHHLLPITIGVICLVLELLNVFSLYLMEPQHLALFLSGIVVSYLALFGYSLPPLRLKVRGITGVLTAAMAQRSLPGLVLISLLETIDASVLLYFVLLTLNGLRWILIHQVIDLENDKSSHIHTYAMDTSLANLRRLMRYVLFPLEIATGIFLTFYLFDTGLVYFNVLAIYWLFEPLYVYFWHRKIEPVSLFSYNFVPGANFLFYFLALVLVVRIAIGSSGWPGWIVLLIAVAVKWKYIYWQTRNFFDLVGIIYRSRPIIGSEEKQARSIIKGGHNESVS